MSRVSVVIPCRNGAAFIPRAIESLRKQTFRDFEVLFVEQRINGWLRSAGPQGFCPRPTIHPTEGTCGGH